jgi:hypothetical protein
MNYLKHYILLIRKANNRGEVSGYTENHHPFPFCIYGENKTSVLTAKEHFIAHLLLYKGFIKRYGLRHYKTIKMGHAFRLMCLTSERLNQRYTSNLFQKLRIQSNKCQTGDLNPAKRPEVRKKISESKKGIPRPDMFGKKYMGCTDIEKINDIKQKSSKFHKNTRIITNDIVEMKIKRGDDLPKGFRYGRLPENIKYIPCSEEKRLKIKKSRSTTNEKYVNMSKDKFITWLLEIKKRGTLYNKNNFGANVTKAIRARSESIEYYQNMFPKEKNVKI